MENTDDSECTQDEWCDLESSTDTDVELTAWHEVQNVPVLDGIADLLRLTLEDAQVCRKDIHKVLQKEGAELDWRESLKRVESAAVSQIRSEKKVAFKRTWQCPSCGKEQKTVDLHKRLRTKTPPVHSSLPLCSEATLKCSSCDYQSC
ncbi:unnamed protein product [Phytomonas sp. EM1]|nr:unnamed protein product [Phytomonas sp. EM1]|eukprot:CCW62920.1 unnamed protein product [Phytomonas sp. isolate EM1]